MPLTTHDIMAHCDICGRSENYAGVAAVPGAAVSIRWCHECLKRGCQPMFVVEATVCLGGPTENDPNAPLWDIEESVSFLKKNGVGPTLDLAGWFLDEYVYQDGQYVQIREFLQNLYDTPPYDLCS